MAYCIWKKRVSGSNNQVQFRTFLNRHSRLSIHKWLIGSHPSSRNNGKVLAWKGASRIVRAQCLWTLKILSRSVTISPNRHTILKNRFNTSLKNYMIFEWQEFFNAGQNSNLKVLLSLVTWDDQEREGSMTRPKRCSSWVCFSCLPSSQKDNAHSSQQESFCQVPMIIYFVFPEWATITCSLDHVAVLERSCWSCNWTSVKDVELA